MFLPAIEARSESIVLAGTCFSGESVALPAHPCSNLGLVQLSSLSFPSWGPLLSGAIPSLFLAHTLILFLVPLSNFIRWVIWELNFESLDAERYFTFTLDY